MNYDMNFEDIIKGLYSNDLYQICEVLNQGKHVNELDVKDLQKALHTGFYYKTHKGTLFEVLYIIPMHILCFQMPTSLHLKNTVLKWGLGMPMTCINYYYEIDMADQKREWYSSYCMETDDFQLVSINSFKRDKQRFIDRIILTNNHEENTFKIIHEDEQHAIIYDYYPLRPVDIPQLYRGRNGFEPMNTYEDTEYGDSRLPSYGKYKGTYVQDIEGYDDDFIDDALDGHPDAYWNID